MDRFGTVYICLNGHVVGSATTAYPRIDDEVCTICGFPTICTCLNCDSQIRGYADIHTSGWTAPTHCHACAEPYPWTLTAGKANDLIHLIDGLSFGDQQRLAQHVKMITKNSPEAVAAARSAKRILCQSDSLQARALLEILTDIASATARKVLLLIAFVSLHPALPIVQIADLL